MAVFIADHPICAPSKMQIAGCVLLLWPDSANRWHVVQDRRHHLKPRAAYLAVWKNGDAVIWTAKCNCTDYQRCPASFAFERAGVLGCPSTRLETVDVK